MRKNCCYFFLKSGDSISYQVFHTVLKWQFFLLTEAMSGLDGTLEEQLGDQRYKITLFVLHRVSRKPPGSVPKIKSMGSCLKS